MRKLGYKLTPAATLQACIALLLILGIILALLLPVSGKASSDPASGQLVVFTEADYSSPVFGSLHFWRALQRHTTSFSSVAAFDQQNALMEAGKTQALVHLTHVTPNFFNTVGSRFLLHGLPLGASEGLVYLSPEFWQKRFASDPNIVGQPLMIQRRIYCIAGVVEASLPLEAPTDVWVLMKPPGSDFASAGKAFKYVARLHQDVSWETASADLKRFVAFQRDAFEKEVFATDLCLSPLQRPELFLPQLRKSENAAHSLQASVPRQLY